MFVHDNDLSDNSTGTDALDLFCYGDVHACKEGLNVTPDLQ